MQQPQYYRTMPVTTLPKKDGYYMLASEMHSELTNEPYTDTYYAYFLEGDWFENEEEARGDENHDAIDVEDFTHWLEPISIPDAEQLREALSDISEMIDTNRQPSLNQIRAIAREALSNTSDGWVRVEQKLPDSTEERKIPVQQFMKDGTQTIGRYHYKNWINKGVTHWRPLPSPPQQINP